MAGVILMVSVTLVICMFILHSALLVGFNWLASGLVIPHMLTCLFATVMVGMF